ncbi:uncharacterized protein BDZ99DRAFT_520341 [Mytilinidion resinicola]|uniref:C6 finger domain protein n=1 Tax=Mytilinidion resinicola TaxID=574789 RepID=A0A6A6YN11_9PEZI|nr:uncharacterized protein BDZ99DRAFT_520341 [Mytilinidion resinicola]KAF2810262.1 hypothetical protein BDZ99DRAFT_520341 [Mytilinidion resinicola]
MMNVPPYWLKNVDEFVGSNPALDRAIQSFSTHICGKSSCNDTLVAYSYSRYGEALAALQKALNNPTQATLSTTLAATTLLCLYELFAPTESSSWLRHADGIGRLIKLRGPRRCETEFDFNMYMEVRGLLINEALFTGKACFLEAEKWHPNATKDSSQSKHPAILLIEEFSHIHAATPGIMRDAEALRREGETSAVNATQRRSVIDRVLKLRQQVCVWSKRFEMLMPPPEDVPSNTADDLFPTVYRFANHVVASIYNCYYATNVVILEALRAGHYEKDYSADLESFIDCVCKSVEYVSGTGLLAPYYLAFPLKVVLMVGSHEKKLWIKRWLERFVESYQVMACCMSKGSKHIWLD